MDDIKQSRKNFNETNIKNTLRNSKKSNKNEKKGAATKANKKSRAKNVAAETSIEKTKDENNNSNDVSEFNQLVQDTGKEKERKESKPATIPQNCSLDELNMDVFNDANNLPRETFLNKYGRSQKQTNFKANANC